MAGATRTMAPRALTSARPANAHATGDRPPATEAVVPQATVRATTGTGTNHPWPPAWNPATTAAPTAAARMTPTNHGRAALAKTLRTMTAPTSSATAPAAAARSIRRATAKWLSHSSDRCRVWPMVALLCCWAQCTAELWREVRRLPFFHACCRRARLAQGLRRSEGRKRGRVLCRRRGDVRLFGPQRRRQDHDYRDALHSRPANGGPGQRRWLRRGTRARACEALDRLGLPGPDTGQLLDG